MMLSKGGEGMIQKRDEWCFLRLRAAQLFEEGDVRGALALAEEIHQSQLERFEMEEEKYEQTENC